jgi:TonB family protein
VTPPTPPAAKPPVPTAPPKVEKTEQAAARPQTKPRYFNVNSRNRQTISTPIRKARPVESMPLPEFDSGPVVFEKSPLPPIAAPPSPVMANAALSGSSASASVNSASSYGSTVNPGVGNKNGPPAVDAVKEADFGPYMKDLQRKIKMSWRPPRGNESKRVVVVFRVSKLGELQAVRVTKSSGEPSADSAAISAVQKVFPYKPFPTDYREPNIDIEFTFDYNVFGDKQRLSKLFNNS